MNPHAHDHGWPGHADPHTQPRAPENFSFAFALGIALNVAFVAIEAIYGVIAHSTALLADAGHNLSDVLVLAVAWGAARLSRGGPTQRFTYGLRGSSILAALFNAVALLVVVGGIAWEAIQRFIEPAPVAGATVMAVAAAGIAVNGVTALLFMRGRHRDLNIRSAFLHMAADALVSLAVVVAGGAVLLFGWLWADAAITLVIAAVIVVGTWGLVRDSVRLALAAVPAGIDPAAVRDYLSGLPGVTRIHDLHIWPLSTTETALTCHLLMPTGHPGDAFTVRVATELQEKYGIGHATLQIEIDEATACALEPDHVV